MSDLQQVLQDLNGRIDGLEEISLIRQDGTVLAQLYQTEKSQDTTSLITELTKLTETVAQELERGQNTETTIKGKKRFLAFYKVEQTDAILGIVGQSDVNFGLLSSGCRNAIEKIKEVI